MDRKRLPLICALVLSAVALINLILFIATGGGANLLLVFFWGITSIYWWATWDHSSRTSTGR